MNSRKYYPANVAAVFDSVSEADRPLLLRVLQEGFNDQAARELFDAGLAEEKHCGTSAHASIDARIQFVPSALRDYDCFVTGETQARLRKAISSLPDKSGTSAWAKLGRPGGWVLRDGPFRVVFRIDEKADRFFVFCIGCWACNPMLKVWRYLDHFKAEDLIRKSELYFRRVDLLEDQYEATPTFSEYFDEQAIAQRAFGSSTSPKNLIADGHKHCTYVCCWRKDPNESWLAWKQYCPQNDGFALQTTWRKLMHLFAQLRRDFEMWCRSVEYIDHRRAEFHLGGPEEKAFYKAIWFSDEREIRMVRFDNEHFGLTQEDLNADAKRIPECHRIKFDLPGFIERIIVNPFASELKRTSLRNLIAEQRPCLLPTMQPSESFQRPVGAAGQESTRK